MWRVWYLKHRVREILENKDGVGVVEIILILVVLFHLSLYSNLSSQVWSRRFSRRLQARAAVFKGGSHSVFKSGHLFYLFLARSNAGSASLQKVKNIRRADMTRAVESIFAEYQKELWEVYGIFAAGRKL